MPLNDNLVAELNRISDVANTMISAHAFMRDSLRSKAYLSDITVIATSLVVAFVGIANSSTLALIRMDAATAGTCSGVCGLVIFLISVVAAQSGWREQADQHAQAVEVCSECRHKCRMFLAAEPQQADVAGASEFAASWPAKTAALIEIKDFVRQKARHRRKIALSKAIDRFPHLCPPIVAGILWIGDTLNASRTAMRKPRGEWKP